MAAATQSIDTPELSRDITALPVAANTTIFAGTIVAVNSDGRAVPAADTAGLRVIGRAEETKVNGATAGAESILIKRGIFRFNNSADDAVDANDIGKVAFVEDDNTVCEAGGTHKVKAGRIVQVDSAGVWVNTLLDVSVPAADTITAAADLAALKTALLAILQAQGIVK